MRVVSLGSGSSGNALLIQTGQTAVLVVAGFAPRTLASRLRQAGVTPSALSGILLTHEHHDHAHGAVSFARQLGIPLISDPRTLAAVLAQPSAAGVQAAPERLELPVGRSTRVHDLDVRSFPVSHDAAAPCGFVLSTGAWSVCVAIDTGEVSAVVVEAMRGAHLLVIEANHDRERLLAGPYPWHLKRRILSATGHLSNEQTSRALENALDDGPRWVWLAHLSRTNNTPDLARAQVREHLRRLGLRHVHPEAMPPGVGPAWESAELWGASRQPGLWDAPAAAPPADAAAPTPSGAQTRARVAPADG